jgi:effector-binding domain-containing protein
MRIQRSIGSAVLLAALALTAAAQQAPTPPVAPPPAQPAFEVQVATAEPVHALVLAMKGSYSQHQDAFGQLGGFLAQRGVEPTGPPFARYFSDPSVGEANLVWEVGFPVPADAPTKAPFEIKELPATLTAVHVHRGPLEELGTAWPQMIEWVVTNGYQIAGPVSQVFKGDMAVSPEVEMRIAVRK